MDTVRQLEPLIPALRRYSRTLVRDATVADDLVQDCLERAILRWSQRRSDRELRAWVFAILHNLAISHLRQVERRGRHLAVEEVLESTLSHGPPQENAAELGQLLQAVHALPDEQRSVVLLVTVEDFSYAEAARVLDIPIGTLMSRLSRARERLRGEKPPEEYAAPLVQPRLRSVK